MVTGGYNIGARVENSLRRCGRNAVAVGGIFSVANHQVDAVEALDGRQPVAQETAAYAVETVVACSPVLMAMRSLVSVYIVTFALFFVVALILLGIIHRNLTRPLFVLNAHMAGRRWYSLKKESKWREPLELEQRFTELTDTIKTQNDELRRKENEINRLNQALDYAKQAEENRRSMIFIGNLCAFMKEVIDLGKEGVFFPQDSEYVCTSELVRQIAAENGRHIVLTRAFNPLLRLFRVSLIKKVFGSLTYEQTEPVSTYSFKEAVHLTERQ